MKLESLSLAEFMLLAKGTRLKKRSRDLALEVLVNGRRQTDVATEYKASKQQVNQAVKTIERVYLANATASNCTVRVSLELPDSLALELGKFVDLLKCESNLDKSKNATVQLIAYIQAASKLLLD